MVSDASLAFSTHLNNKNPSIIIGAAINSFKDIADFIFYLFHNYFMRRRTEIEL